MATPSSVPFKYEVQVTDEATFVTCHGKINSGNAADVKQLIRPMIPRCGRIVVDLSEVKSVDSSGLGTLVGLKLSAASAAYCNLEFINFSPLVKDLLRTTRLSELFGAS